MESNCKIFSRDTQRESVRFMDNALVNRTLSKTITTIEETLSTPIFLLNFPMQIPSVQTLSHLSTLLHQPTVPSLTRFKVLCPQVTKASQLVLFIHQQAHASRPTWTTLRRMSQGMLTKQLVDIDLELRITIKG